MKPQRRQRAEVTRDTARGCYCGICHTHPELFREQRLPEGFCGWCEKCGKPGHARHFPGAVPYTGAWCDRHYSLMQWYDPRTHRGCLIWAGLLLAVVGAIAIINP